MNLDFFESLQTPIDTSKIKIDRPKHSKHPRFPELIYPLDYGYLEGTSSSDGSGIDVWIGADGGTTLSYVVAVCDLLKKDTELKLLIGCSENDLNIVLSHHRRGEMTAIVIPQIK